MPLLSDITLGIFTFFDSRLNKVFLLLSRWTAVLFNHMISLTNAALFFLAAGILTSVSILSVYQVLFVPPLLFFSYLAFKNKRFQLPKSAYWLLAFTAVAVVSLVLNFDIIPKPSKNFGRLKYYLYGVGGIFVFQIWFKDASAKAKMMITNMFLLSVVVAGVYAIGQYVVTGVRAKSLTDTMRYGYGSSMFLLLLLSALIHHEKCKSWLNFRFGLIAFVIGVGGMYATFARGALLGFLAGLPFVLYLYRPKIGIMVGALCLIIVGTLAGFYFYGSWSDKDNRLIMSSSNNGDMIRRSQWKAAVIAIQERPVLGWGLSNFHSQLKRIKYDNDLEAKEYHDAHSHNLFLEITTGTGFIGLFFFLGWLLSWAWESYKGSELTKLLVIPFGVAFVISSQFEVTFDANNACMIFTVYSMSAAYLMLKKTTASHV